MKPSIVFFGTGPVSLRCLEGLYGHVEFEAIITRPEALKPNGKPHAAPVKAWAEDHGVAVFQPATKDELASLVTSGKFNSPVGLVVDYGLIIPQSVINAFPKGIINSHFSLLPEWRGADPITFSILSGQTVTGVSLMLIVPKLDEGDLLAEEQMELPPVTNAVLTEHLCQLSNHLLITTIPKYLAGEITPYPQDNSGATYSRKLTKADGKLDWTKPADQLEREVRAYLGWPGSYTQIAGRDVIITAAHVDRGTAVEQGQITAENGLIVIGTADGAFVIDRLKPAGKRDMTAAEFIAGVPELR